jgi:hypothetical protein
VNGAYLSVDQNHWDSFMSTIKETPRIAVTMVKRDQLAAFRDTTGKSIGILRTLYFVLAVIVSFGVVYNSARIALSERSRELATLRVVGFTLPEVRGVLDGCPVGGGEGAATIDADWGEPGLTPAEKIYGWNSFIVLAMLSGKPDAPVNAVAPDARATCHIRYTVDTDPNSFEASLRRHLNEQGFGDIVIENAGVRMAASRTPPNHPWVRWAQESMQKTLGKRVQIIPNSSGGLPGDVFVDHIGVPLVWVPHSYNGCKQHGPDEHFLIAPAREGILAFTGMWWDLGQGGTP